MAEETSIEISGIEEACAMLDSMPKEIQKKAVARALAAGSVPIAASLEAHTPVAEYPAGIFSAPGSLSMAVSTDIVLDPNGHGGVARIGFTGGQGYVANFVEYGHLMVAHGAKWSDRMKNYVGKLLGVVAPHPFMRYAAEDSAEPAVESVISSLNETIKEEIPGASDTEAA